VDTVKGRYDMYQNLDMEEMEGRKNGTLIIISLNNPIPNSNPRPN